MKNPPQENPQNIRLDHLKEAIEKLEECVNLLRAVYMDLDLSNEVFPVTNAPGKEETTFMPEIITEKELRIRRKL